MYLIGGRTILKFTVYHLLGIRDPNSIFTGTTELEKLLVTYSMDTEDAKKTLIWVFGMKMMGTLRQHFHIFLEQQKDQMILILHMKH